MLFRQKGVDKKFRGWELSRCSSDGSGGKRDKSWRSPSCEAQRSYRMNRMATSDRRSGDDLTLHFTFPGWFAKIRGAHHQRIGYAHRQGRVCCTSPSWSSYSTSRTSSDYIRKLSYINHYCCQISMNQSSSSIIRSSELSLLSNVIYDLIISFLLSYPLWKA